MNTTAKSLVAGMRVLVVDDEMAVALSLEMLLGTMDCDVVKAGRLHKAMRLAATETLNGALLDINLAGDRIDPVATELERRGIPFVFMTGYDPNQIEGKYSGHATLPKPFDEAELEQTMAQMFIPTE